MRKVPKEIIEAYYELAKIPDALDGYIPEDDVGSVWVKIKNKREIMRLDEGPASVLNFEAAMKHDMFKKIHVTDENELYQDRK